MVLPNLITPLDGQRLRPRSGMGRLGFASAAPALAPLRRLAARGVPPCAGQMRHWREVCRCCTSCGRSAPAGWPAHGQIQDPPNRRAHGGWRRGGVDGYARGRVANKRRAEDWKSMAANATASSTGKRTWKETGDTYRCSNEEGCQNIPSELRKL